MRNLINITKHGTKSYPASIHLVDMIAYVDIYCNCLLPLQAVMIIVKQIKETTYTGNFYIENTS